MALYHAYSQTVADGTATSVVRPSDWNSAHAQQITLAGNTAGQSTISGTNIIFQGGNNVTLSANTAAGAATIVISGANTVAQSVQTQASGAIARTGFTSTTTNGTAVTAALGTNGLSMAVPQYLTTYVNDLTSGRAGTGFTSTTTAGTAITAALGTNGLTMAVPQYITTYVNDLTSGRAGTGTTLATTNISATLSVNTNGIALSLNNLDDHFVGWNLVGNTAGTTSTSLTTEGNLFLSGGNNITLSGNSNTIVISAGAGGGTTNQTGPNIGVSTLGFTQGITGTVSTGNVVFVGGDGIILSQSIGAGSTNATILIRANTMPAWANQLYYPNTTTYQVRNSTSIIFPVVVNNPVQFDHFRQPLSVSVSQAAAVATTANTTFNYGVTYAFRVVFFATELATPTVLDFARELSGGLTHRVTVQAGAVGSQYSVTHALSYPVNNSNNTSTFSTSYATSSVSIVVSSSVLSAFTGQKHLELGVAAGTISPDMYWIAMGVGSTTATGGNAALTAGLIVHSNIAMTQPSGTAWGFFGQAANASVGVISGLGSYTSSNSSPVDLAMSRISGNTQNLVPFVYLEYDG